MSMTATTTSDCPVLSRTDMRLLMIGLMLAILISALDQTIVAIALPRIAAELGGFGLLAWVVSGYLVAVAVATPIYGKLGDLLGRRLMLLSAIGIFTAASVGCALARSMEMLIAARILQGIGGGGLFSMAQAIIADVVPPRERSRYQGYVSITYALASVLGPAAGAMMVHYLSWRWAFWINLPLALVTVLMARRPLALLPVPRVKRPIDYAGAMLMSAGLTALLTGVTRAGQGAPWLDAQNLRLFACAALLSAIFFWQQRRAVEPVLPLSLFRIPTVVLCCAILFVAFFQVISLSTMIPLRLQMAAGAGATDAAGQLVPLTLAIPCGAWIGGTAMARTGRFRPSLLAGTILTAMGLALLALLEAHSGVAIIVLLIVAGIGIGLQFPTGLVAVQNAVPRQHIGVATATTAFSRSLGAALGVAILTAALWASLRTHVQDMPLAHGGIASLQEIIDGAVTRMSGTARAQLELAVQQAFRTIFLLSAAAALFTVLLAALLPAKPPAGPAPSP